MKTYRHLFFDLDRTFWDVETNQEGAHRQLYGTFRLERLFTGYDDYFAAFTRINDRLWEEYETGLLKQKELRSERFRLLLESRGIADPGLAVRMNDAYLRILPRYHALLPGSLETLDYLRGRGYPMYILTNGFNGVQHDKVRYSGLQPYFRRIITSEEAGINKPFPGIFEYALRVTGAERESSVMTGDDPRNDIRGALGVGMDCVFLNTKRTPHEDLHPTYEIHRLPELKTIF